MSTVVNSPASRSPKRLLRIALLDPSVTSHNTGDQIISEACQQVIEELFPGSFVVRLTTHEFHLWESHRLANECDLVFVGGSNLLKSSMLKKNQWKLSLLDYFYRRTPSVLLGCGWHYYEQPPRRHTALMLRKVLSPRFHHSVRDGYTKQQLDAIPIPRSLNTACVTMWRLTPEHCQRIPTGKADTVVFTLTAYKPDVAADRAMIDLLCRSYRQVYLWVQQLGDFEYAMSLADDRVRVLPASLAAYTSFLRENHADYVGSRLHGGIRALQLGKRSLILSIDNRATEIARDTDLPVVARTATDAIGEWIHRDAPTAVRLPTEAIDLWKTQFRDWTPERDAPHR